MKNIHTYATYGQDPNGGITRPSFSEQDYQVRERFIKELKEMNLDVHIDSIANIWGRYKGSSDEVKPIVIGSHLDTVPNGGKYDGALGVLTAKEIIQTFKDNNITLKHPVEIVSFTAEEPNDFNLSTMGSRTLLNKLKQSTLMKTTDSRGTLLKDAVDKAGGSLKNLPLSKKEIGAFVELHIEQGKRLENAELPVGIVDSIVGIYRDRVEVKGVANHAGTTMMKDRNDALLAASEMAIAVENVLLENGSDAVATVGKYNVYPNAANIIPGKVEMILEIRSKSQEERQFIKTQIYNRWEQIVEERKVTLKTDNILDQQERKFDKDIVNCLRNTAEQMKVPCTTFASMAGHDATHIAEIAKTAMLFVKSINGKSHCPEEYSTQEDIEVAANVMLRSIIKIDQEL